MYIITLKIPHDPPKEQWFVGKEISVVQQPLHEFGQGYMSRTQKRREQRKKKWQELQQQVNDQGRARHPRYPRSKNMVWVREKGKTSNATEGQGDIKEKQLKLVANPEEAKEKRKESVKTR